MKKDVLRIFEIMFKIIKIMVLIFFVIFAIKLFNYDILLVNEVNDVEIVVNSFGDDSLSLNIVPNVKQSHCAFTKNIVEDVDSLDFLLMENNICSVNIDMSSYYVYFKDEYGTISEPIFVNDYVVNISLKDRYYLPIGGEIDLNSLVMVIGNVNYSWEYDSNVSIIENGILKGVNNGEFLLKFIVDDEVLKESRVVVTDGIISRPKSFNSKKAYLPCRAYDVEKSRLMDEILEYRISEVGYGTRAGVVEAARFLALEFPYRISYFYENGRVSNTGVNLADGEGRYYHKGLYLNEEKFADIKYTFSGKAIWGCGLRNNEPNQPDYPRNAKLPNGLDCSGFVTWAILNGGFDVGDIGAGESPAPNQLTDRGKFTKLSRSLINSGKIKVGDLFNFWGHISILVGEDANNYYIAESLNTYFGVVIRTYPKNRVMNTFTHVVLMEDYYKKDGNLTKMWY